MRASALRILWLAALVPTYGRAESCPDGRPGPGKGVVAPLGPDGKNKAKFLHPEQHKVQLDLLDRALKNIAQKCNQPELQVNSGYRSKSYNASVGSRKGSQHLCGNAADMQFCQGKSLEQMFKILAEAGCGGIGCYPTFVQCDIGPKRQWGCPDSWKRPPPDDPIPQGDQGDKSQPASVYDSATPSESPSGGGGAPGGGSSGGASSTVTGTPQGEDTEHPEEHAEYPKELAAQSLPREGANLGDMRGPLGARTATSPESTVTRPKGFVASGSPVDGGSAITRGYGYAGAYSSGASSASPAVPPARAAGNVGGGGASLAGSTNGLLKSDDGKPADGSGKTSSASAGSGGSGGGGGGSGSGSGGGEAYSSYSAGKDLGKGNVEMAGRASELDADIQRIQAQEFGADRAPASFPEEDAQTGLFERVHSAHMRCLRGGCLTAGGIIRK